MDQQVAGLDEVAALGELLDRDAAIAQDAGLTVDIRDRAGRRPGVHVPGIEGHVAGVGAQRPDVDGVLVLGADHDRQVEAAAVGDGELGGLAVGVGHCAAPWRG